MWTRRSSAIIIGVVVLLVAGGAWYLLTRSPAPAAQQPAANASRSDYHDNIYLTKTDAAKGSFMTDFAGMTLYAYDKDSADMSNCTGACAQAWRPYSSGATAQGIFPHNIGVITRADGSRQFTWMGKPLYYCSQDVNPGDTKGDGVGRSWHIVSM
jgi:predicted lipoprotein with Yx(FWY)xxD motif